MTCYRGEFQLYIFYPSKLKWPYVFCACYDYGMLVFAIKRKDGSL